MPYVIMFTIKAMKTKDWVNYGILAGIFLGLQFLEGGMEVFQFTGFAVGFILFFYLFGKAPLNRIAKSFLVGVIILAVTFGIVAVKLLPATDFASISNRQQQFDYETTLGTHLDINTAFRTIVDDRSLSEPLKHPIKGGDVPGIGIISAILILFSIPFFKKKNYLLFLVLGIFGILLITNSPLVWLLWKFFPFFNKQKHVIKGLVVLLLALCVLAGYGAKYLTTRFKDRKSENIVYGVIIILLIITSWGFTYNIRMKNPYPEIDSVEMMKYMSNDKDMFRFKVWETNGIDWGTNYYSVSYNLQDIYGYVNLWNPEYMPQFLSIANSQPAKFFGMMNMKYMTSMQPLNISGFRLIEKFPDKVSDCKYDKESVLINAQESKHCPDYSMLLKAWGPYLYINDKFLPRAYTVEHGILVIGEGYFTMQNGQPIDARYALMLNPKFNPAKSVIIRGRQTISQYSLEELKRYSAIVLTQGSIIDAQGQSIAKAYSDSGGIIPSQQGDIEKMFDVLDEEFQKVDYKAKNYNHYRASINGAGNSGRFLVLSEMFSVFSGWKAYSGQRQLEILNANVMNSAVYTGGESQQIDFVYFPDSFRNGLIITIITVILISGYFVFAFLKRRKEKVNIPPQQSSGNENSNNLDLSS